MLIVYSLSNCDSCKKALKWLIANGIQFENRDIRKDGISSKTIDAAIIKLGWEKVLNRRSTSWRNLSEADKADIDPKKATELIVANCTLMKRPFFVIGNEYWVGFDDSVRARLLK